ncbi:Uncharacterised protein [Cedecea neteri]|uniref:Secreted protein n=1 Tax=Cedecea neteri TaxID=158822 RepID=A0A2X3JEJ5_9ENTR|nr:Uncharacterised protein [Cedecea neteri]
MTMNNVMKKIFRPRVMTCALLLVASKGALATCSFMDSRFGPDDSVALSFGTVVVQRDTPVGTVVCQTRRLPRSVDVIISCSATPAALPRNGQ